MEQAPLLIGSVIVALVALTAGARPPARRWRWGPGPSAVAKRALPLLDRGGWRGGASVPYVREGRLPRTGSPLTRALSGAARPRQPGLPGGAGEER